mgnify:CR=1 FL=1
MFVHLPCSARDAPVFDMMVVIAIAFRGDMKRPHTSRRILLIPFASLQARLFGLFGLVCGCIYAFGGFAIDALVTIGWMNSVQTPGLSVGTILAFGALVGMPLVGGAFGFLAGLVGAVVYNFSIRLVPTLQMDGDIWQEQSSIRK